MHLKLARLDHEEKVTKGRWRLLARQSYWENGKAKKRDYHLVSISAAKVLNRDRRKGLYLKDSHRIKVEEALGKVRLKLKSRVVMVLVREAELKIAQVLASIIQADRDERAEQARIDEERSRQKRKRDHRGEVWRRPSFTEKQRELLKTAYRYLAKQHHPDKGGDPEQMKELNDLKERLGF
jgi:hypothetical protein